MARYIITDEEFQNRLKSENPDVFTDTIYENPDTILDCSCKYGHTWTAIARNVLWNHTKCPFCTGRLPIKGVNDLWTTHPELAKLLKNPEDGYNISYGSGKKVWWICPNCGEELFKIVSNVVNKGLSCNNCSDMFSFPNRFMASLLNEVGIDYTPEYIIKGKNFRYDFYIPSLSCIIEMHGRQHYEEWTRSNKTLTEVQENDNQKYLYALKNNIKYYIIIDSRNSSVSYIKKNIYNSILPSLIYLNNIDWNNVAYNSFKSLMRIAIDYYNDGMTNKDIAKLLKKSISTINKWIHTGEELGLCKFNPSKGFLKEEKPVILLNTKQIYPSISKAAKDTGLSLQGISEACNHIKKYFGMLDNKPMIWMFLSEYNSENFEDFEVFITHHNGIKIHQYTLDGIYLNTYDSISMAKKITGISTIINVCLKKKYSAGGFRWYYADDEMQPDKSKIIGIPRYYGEDKVYSKKVLNYQNLIDNKYKDILIDIYDRYGNYIKTCVGYKEVENKTKCSKETIYKCCSGKQAYSGNYVFRYHNDPFNKYFSDMQKQYINVYYKDTLEFIGVYYSIAECVRKLNLKDFDRKRIAKNLKNEIDSVYLYKCYYANDLTQPDKSKIIN